MEKPIRIPELAETAPAWPSEEPWLSLRELDVLDLVARGFSDKEIALRIGVSAATVNTHLRHVYAKLRAHNRAHAVAVALRSGVLKSPFPD
jgi:DNA-binding CsgD family transcriptional regulator